MTTSAVDGAVGVESNSGIGIGVAGTGWNEMDMTTDSEEDSKLHTPVSLTGTPCSRPRGDYVCVGFWRGWRLVW